MSKDTKTYMAGGALILGLVVALVFGPPLYREYEFRKFLRTYSGQAFATALSQSGARIHRPRHLEYDLLIDTRILVRFEISESDFQKFIAAAQYTRGDWGFSFWHEPPSWWQPKPERVEVYVSTAMRGFQLGYDRAAGVAYFVHPQT